MRFGKHNYDEYQDWSSAVSDCPLSGKELNVEDVNKPMAAERVALCPKCSFQFVLPLESETFRVPLHAPSKGLPMAQA